MRVVRNVFDPRRLATTHIKSALASQTLPPGARMVGTSVLWCCRNSEWVKHIGTTHETHSPHRLRLNFSWRGPSCPPHLGTDLPIHRLLVHTFQSAVPWSDLSAHHLLLQTFRSNFCCCRPSGPPSRDAHFPVESTASFVDETWREHRRISEG